MKNLLLTISTFLLSINLYSQGQIISISTSPVNPTTNDFVKVYVDLMFNSGSCDMDNQGNTTTGNTTTAYAMHCVGMLTVMCHVTDSFDLGYLQAGNHTFNFTLSSGSGGPGCSPGIVPDDTDSYNFTVTQALGIEDPAQNNKVSFYPNPMNESTVIKIDPSILTETTSLEILDASARVVFSKSNLTNETSLYSLHLSGGIYFYRIMDEKGLIATEKFVVE